MFGAAFAVNAIRSWLAKMGRERYPAARQLIIAADCGGSNGARVRLWKLELQKADETGLTIQVSHYPPGTSKWNPIEHRQFCHITQNWRGRPLISQLALVELNRRDHHDNQAAGRKRHRRKRLSQGYQGDQRRDRQPQHQRRRLPSRVEPHHRTSHENMTRLFLRGSLAKERRRPRAAKTTTHRRN